MPTKIGGDKGDEADDEPEGEEPRRRAAQVRRRWAAGRPEESPGSSPQIDRSMHHIVHVWDHG